MDVAFTQLSQWLWSKKHQDDKISKGSSSNSLAETCLLELDIVSFPLPKGNNVASSTRKIKRKWQTREERKIDKEHDLIVVPSDGECISASESDSDWSIGWLEPHGSGFQSDDESDSSFAVLVPCYGHSRNNMVDDEKGNVLNVIGSMPDSFSPDSRKYMEQWLCSLQPNPDQQC